MTDARPATYAAWRDACWRVWELTRRGQQAEPEECEAAWSAAVTAEAAVGEYQASAIRTAAADEWRTYYGTNPYTGELLTTEATASPAPSTPSGDASREWRNQPWARR